MLILSIGFIIAASIGAFLRYQTGLFLTPPWGTLLVNVLGSLLIGFMAVSLDKYSPQIKIIVLVALLGSLTTFSSYSLELVRFFNEGALSKAFLYFLSANTLCFLGCFLGWKIAQNLVISH